MDNENENKKIENLSPSELEKETKDLVTLTEQNWLFINAFLSCGSITKAYKIAGYKGESRAAPYVLYKQLKSRIEDLGNLDVTSRARLQADLKQVLDLPLAESKKELSLSEWLRVRKFVASITPDVQSAKPNISVIVINRAKREMDTANSGNSTINQSDLGNKDVIDVDIIEPKA